MQLSFGGLRRTMPCHLCCQLKIDLVKIENWLLCSDCRRPETLDTVLDHLRNGDGFGAERVIRNRRLFDGRTPPEQSHGDVIAVVFDPLDENVGA